MDKFKEIRPIVLGVVRKGNKLLVSKGYDKSKNQEFYRCLGGGIEFLERSEDALKREFKEEINIEIELAQSMGKRIIAIEPWGAERTSSKVKSAAHSIVRWNTDSIINAIRGY